MTPQNPVHRLIALLIITLALSFPLWIAFRLDNSFFEPSDVVDYPTTPYINSNNALSYAYSNHIQKDALLSTQNSQIRVPTTLPVTTVTVLLDKRIDEKVHAYSIFDSKTLERFGSGTIRYKTEFRNFAREKEAIQQAKAPCLLVNIPTKVERNRRNMAPHCRILMVNDEWCKHNSTDIDVRFYYYEGMELWNTTEPSAISAKTPVYLPLGPRSDFWEAFEKETQQKNHSSLLLKPISERKYIWNAVFTKSTSTSRSDLKEKLNASQLVQQNPKDYFVRIPGMWKRKLTNHHLNPDEYAKVLMDSKFTLSPAGHNPECFRIFEAIIAGSIPIVVMDDEYGSHECQKSFLPFLGANPAPVVVLPSWNYLEERLQELLRDSTALDRQQKALQRWYTEFMRLRILQFEDIIRRPRTEET